eukprot:scaffold18580_cov106-Isochrysis_galbana.AAC.3
MRCSHPSHACSQWAAPLNRLPSTQAMRFAIPPPLPPDSLPMPCCNASHPHNLIVLEIVRRSLIRVPRRSIDTPAQSLPRHSERQGGRGGVGVVVVVGQDAGGQAV